MSPWNPQFMINKMMKLWHLSKTPKCLKRNISYPMITMRKVRTMKNQFRKLSSPNSKHKLNLKVNWSKFKMMKLLNQNFKIK